MRTPQPCSHEGYHDYSSHYNKAEGTLSFVMVCPLCGWEHGAQNVKYRPDFNPLGNDQYLKPFH